MGFRHYFWTKGEPWNSVRSWLAPRVLYSLHSALMCSVRISTSGEDCGRPFRPSPDGRGAIVLVWHDLTLPTLHLIRDKNLSAISSQSRSAQINAAWLQLLGVNIVWGSAGKRGGIQALRTTLPLLEAGKTLLITPDGPKGPRHRVQPGALYLASRTGATIYPWGVAATSAWRLKTWDRHLIPKPFSHVFIHLGTPLQVPSTLEREEMLEWQETVNRALEDAVENAHRAMLASTRKLQQETSP